MKAEELGSPSVPSATNHTNISQSYQRLTLRFSLLLSTLQVSLLCSSLLTQRPRIQTILITRHFPIITATTWVLPDSGGYCCNHVVPRLTLMMKKYLLIANWTDGLAIFPIVTKPSYTVRSSTNVTSIVRLICDYRRVPIQTDDSNTCDRSWEII